MSKFRKCVIDKSGTKSDVTLPRFRPKQGMWTGGDSNTLYAFTSTITGKVFVRPGHKHDLRNIGPDATVRVATKAEAEEHWQNPLHSGWKTACGEDE